MLIARGDPMTFVQRPISAGLLVLGAILLVLAVLPMIRSKRETVFVEE
jgi:TctA family transporter